MNVADETRRDDERLADEVLGINDGPDDRNRSDMPFDRSRHDSEASARRRRRADDLAEEKHGPDTGPSDGPDGMKVQI
jgi:hypothetical protein